MEWVKVLVRSVMAVAKLDALPVRDQGLAVNAPGDTGEVGEHALFAAQLENVKVANRLEVDFGIVMNATAVGTVSAISVFVVKSYAQHVRVNE